MYSHMKLGVVVLTAALTLVGCKSKSNKEATMLPPPPPLETEPLPASLSQQPSSPAPAAPAAPAPTIALPPPAPMAYEEPAPAPAAMPAPAQPVSGNLYRVKAGDTLWSIARRHYGSGDAWRQIAQVNNISDPKQLKAGMDIILP